MIQAHTIKLHTALRLHAAAGRIGAEDKGAGRLAPKTRQGAAARQRQTKAGGAFFAPKTRRGSMARLQAVPSGGRIARAQDSRLASVSEPKLETPRPRKARRWTGRRRRAAPEANIAAAAAAPRKLRNTIAGGGGRRPGRTRSQAAALETG